MNATKLARATLRSGGAISAAAATFILGSYLGLSAGTSANQSNADPDCRPLVIGADGTGDRAIRLAGGRTGVDAEMDRYAANGAQVEHPDYPGTIWPDGAWTMDESNRILEDKVHARVQQYYADCPDGHVTLIGHSQSAEAMGDVGQQLQAEGDTHGTTVVLFSDPAHPNQGFLTTFPFDLPGVSMGERSGTDLPDTTRVCHYYDIVCNSHPLGDPLLTLQAFVGYLVRGDHGYAPGEADDNTGDSTDAPTPTPPILELPGSLPTGLQDSPAVDVFPVWEPGTLPTPIPNGYLATYVPTPVADYLPDAVKPFLPPEVLNFVPGPLPALPEIHIPGLF